MKIELVEQQGEKNVSKMNTIEENLDETLDLKHLSRKVSKEKVINPEF